MRDLVRIAGGVALGVGLLVAAGAGRDSPAPRPPPAIDAGHADGADDADDVEAPVPRSPSAAPTPAAPTPPATQPPGPPPRAGWRAGAHPPQEIPPSMVVRAARRRAAPKACAQPANGAASPACPIAPPRPAVEIQWNAPGSMP